MKRFVLGFGLITSLSLLVLWFVLQLTRLSLLAFGLTFLLSFAFSLVGLIRLNMPFFLAGLTAVYALFFQFLVCLSWFTSFLFAYVLLPFVFLALAFISVLAIRMEKAAFQKDQPSDYSIGQKAAITLLSFSSFVLLVLCFNYIISRF